MEQTANHHTAHLLKRNTREGKIAGVSAGIGDYLGIDPVLVRLMFVLLVFAGGFGLLAYLVAWLVIPPEDESQSLAPDFERRLPPSRTHWRTILGGLVLVVGIFAFVGSVGIWWLPNIEVWPLILIAIGAGLLLLRRRDDRARRDDGVEPPSPDADPAAPTTGGPGDDSTAQSRATDGDAEQAEETAETPEEEPTTAVATLDAEQEQLPAEATALAPLSKPSPEPATTASEPTEAQWSPASEPPAEKKRRRFPVGRATLGAILIAAAVAGLLDATGVLDVSAQGFLILALAITGGGLVASAFFGRSIGLVLLALLLALMLALASLVNNVSLTEGAGDRTIRPTTVAELEESYQLSAGKLTVDLRGLDLAGADAVVDAGVGVGELVVLLPVGVDAAIEGKAAMGEVDLFGRAEGGLDVERTADVSGFTQGPAFPGAPTQLVPPAGSLQIEADVGIGKVEARLDS